MRLWMTGKFELEMPFSCSALFDVVSGEILE